MFSLPEIVGLFSIGCWVIVFTPQIYRTYCNKSGEGLSLFFLSIWLLGDIYSFTGAIIQNLLPTVIWLGVYHAVADIFLICQVLYYRHVQTGLDVENTPLLGEEQKVEKETHSLYMGVCIFLSSLLTLYLFGLGWTSAILYVFSRIPQIVKNQRAKSVHGLSLWLFLVGILGNLTFCASVLLESPSTEHISKNLPWLVGSAGTLFFDCFIGFQFYLYQQPSI